MACKSSIVSNPAAPVAVGQIVDDGTNTALAGAYAVYVSGKYAYVIGNNDNGLQIIDVSNPAAPVAVGQIVDDGTNTALAGAYAVYVSGKYAYVASRTDNGLQIIDVSNPTAPTAVGQIVDDGTNTALAGARSVAVAGKYAYVAGYADNGLQIIELSGAELPTANIGNLYASNLNVSDNARINNDLYVGNGLDVGGGGIYSQGPVSAYVNSSNSALTVSQAGTGDIVDIKNGTTSAFKVTKATVDIAQPLDLQVEGDTGLEYNLNFLNTATSFINSAGPLILNAGDPNSYENLTLATAGTGDIVVDISNSLLGFKIIGGESVVFTVDPNGNVVIGGNNSKDADLTVKRNIYTQGGNLVLNNLSTPTGTTVTTMGTAGTTTYGYRISAINGNGETLASATATIASGNATLSATNYNAISWNAVPGATGYKIYGRTSGTELYLATVNAPITSYNDIGGVTPTGALPTSNTTGGMIVYPASGGPTRIKDLMVVDAELPTANPAVLAKVDGTHQTYTVLDFADGATSLSAFWHPIMPASYDGNNVSVTAYWYSDTGSTNAVRWCAQVSGVSPNNAEVMDASLGTAVCTNTAASATAGQLVSTTNTLAVGTLGANKYATIKLYREANNASDTLTSTARLVKVKLTYTAKQEAE